MSDSPTIVLVHGALTDASVWRRVSDRLQRAGHRVAAPSIPMRTLDGDAAYLRTFLESLPGPLVVAGHSYAGSVLSHPDSLTPAVRALVFVAAFQQDAGETAGELNDTFPGSLLTPDNLLIRKYPDSTPTARRSTCGRRSSPRSTPAISTRPTSPYWPPRRSPSTPPPSAVPSAHRRPGTPCPPGASCRPTTYPSRLRRCGGWPSVPAPRSAKSRPRTPCHSPSRTP